MWIVALTLGFFGSIHCIGMCGPLAIAFCDREGASSVRRLYTILSYNIGRTLTYGALGIVFGLIGSMLLFAELQKIVSIGLGIVFIIAFLLSIDIDQLIGRISWLRSIYDIVQRQLSSLIRHGQAYPPIVLGLVNGLLPCGLVYLAIAGSLASGGILSGMMFMIFFGLGTIPAMAALSLSVGLMGAKTRLGIRRVIPYVTLAFGIFLIYRGIVVEMPLELNFWEAVRNPVMCH